MMAFAIIGCLGGIIVQMENCLAIANMVRVSSTGGGGGGGGGARGKLPPQTV